MTTRAGWRTVGHVAPVAASRHAVPGGHIAGASCARGAERAGKEVALESLGPGVLGVVQPGPVECVRDQAVIAVSSVFVAGQWNRMVETHLAGAERSPGGGQRQEGHGCVPGMRGRSACPRYAPAPRTPPLCDERGAPDGSEPPRRVWHHRTGHRSAVPGTTGGSRRLDGAHPVALDGLHDRPTAPNGGRTRRATASTTSCEVVAWRKPKVVGSALRAHRSAASGSSASRCRYSVTSGK